MNEILSTVGKAVIRNFGEMTINMRERKDQNITFIHGDIRNAIYNERNSKMIVNTHLDSQVNFFEIF